ncbi:hypothetical protein [Ferrimonas marina]|uniref:hypothetical protein n=1 Tax=Ferrimonas marina TaxID=299255 RepID=UPI0008301C04|nr:hypothetical protein [Ferrimonas marina]
MHKPLALLLSLSLLAACSSESDSPDNPDIPDEKPELERTYGPAASAYFDVLDRQLSFAELLHDTHLQLAQIGHIEESICSNGGLLSAQWHDNDGSEAVSAGDQYQLHLRDCQLPWFAEVLDGSLLFEITEVESQQQDQTLSVQLGLSDIVLKDGGEYQLDNHLELTMRLTPNRYALEVHNPEAITLYHRFEEEQILQPSTFGKTVDSERAFYQVQGSGEVQDLLKQQTVQFQQSTPWQGYLMEYPHQGAAELTPQGLPPVTLASNFVVDSRMINFQQGQWVEKSQWLNRSQGVLWRVPGVTSPNNPREYKASNLQFVAQLNAYLNGAYPIQGTMQVQLSRPIERIATSVSFRTTQSPFDYIDAHSIIEGGLLSITPTRPLEPGRTYQLESFVAYGENGTSLSVSTRSNFTVSDQVVPVLTAQSGLFRVDDTPWLSAKGSHAKEGEAIDIEWFEISDTGLVFETPTELHTGFTPGRPGDIEIGLRVTNELGQSDTVTQTLRDAADDQRFIYFDSPAGEYIGQGKRRYLSSRDGYFTNNSNSEQLDTIRLRYDNDRNWSLDLQSGDGTPLREGRYEGATRYPFNRDGEPGVNFSGEGRGCNTINGEFEIHQLQRDAHGNLLALAVDYTQYCSNGTEPLRGKLRYNTDYPINLNHR